MEKSRLRQTMLLDFYGELLTDKQRECYDLLSISRQGVWDNIRRAEISISEYEEKTGLLERFDSIKEKIAEIKSACAKLGAVAGDITVMLSDLEADL